MSLAQIPFTILRVPNLKLKTPKIDQPEAMTVFAIVFFSYFLVLSGLIYDVIVEPPSIGSDVDPVTGAVKPVAFLPYRVNGQYIIEGLTAGFLFVLGGSGFIILDKANMKNTSDRNRYLLVVLGALCILGSYNIGIVFLRIKVPGYLSS